jgi:hypothetical protein
MRRSGAAVPARGCAPWSLRSLFDGQPEPSAKGKDECGCMRSGHVRMHVNDKEELKKN